MSEHLTDAGGDPLVPFIHGLLVKMVDHPEAVEVRVQAGHPTLYEARVAADDVGQVVGREGRIVKALRTLVAAAAQKRGDRATFEIAEPDA